MEIGIIWIMIVTLMSNSAYGMIAPLLPLLFKEKGISDEWVGIIFATYSIATIVSSPFVALFIRKIGKINLIASGIALIGTVFMLYGFMEKMESA